MDKTNLPVICLMGPTATGKSQLAMQLAKTLPLSIVSVDSAMVYRGLNIGTAKPSPKELKEVRHRLIDICDPNEPYSAGRFYTDVLKEINNIQKENKIPLLVGGSMLYFYVLQNFSRLPPAHSRYRRNIQAEAEEKGLSFLYDLLQKADPVAASRIHPNDTQRIKRALELNAITHKPLHILREDEKFKPLPYLFINIVLAHSDRKYHHDIIAERFHHMLKAGLIDEVKNLYLNRELPPDLPALRMVNYRQVLRYLDGLDPYETLCEKAIAATRQLAKRQGTWLRQKWKDAYWLDCENKNLFKHTHDLIESCVR